MEVTPNPLHVAASTTEEQQQQPPTSEEVDAAESDMVAQIALLHVGEAVDEIRAAAAKAVEEGAKPAPVKLINWREELKRLDEQAIDLTKRFFVTSQAKLTEKRTIEEQMPKDEAGWKGLCYKVLVGSQVERMKQYDFYAKGRPPATYEAFFKHLKHTDRAFLTNFSQVNWVDPHMSPEYNDRLLGEDLEMCGIGYDYAAFIARPDNLPADEESYAIFVARITSLDDRTVNARTALERTEALQDKEHKRANSAALKRLQQVAFARSSSGVFLKPSSSNIHGKHVSVRWNNDDVDVLRFYELPHCLGDSKDVLDFQLPPGVVTHYDLYWPFLVFSCPASEVANLGFLWRLDGASAMEDSLRKAHTKLVGDMIIVVDLDKRAWVRSRPSVVPVAALSIFPRQTSWIDKNYPHEKLRILWNMSSVQQVGLKKASKQYSKKEDADLKALEGLTTCEYLLERTRSLDEDDLVEDALLKQEFEEVVRKAELDKRPVPEDMPRGKTEFFPKPHPEGTVAQLLWKTAEQELREKERTNHSWRSRPDEPAVALYVFHCNTLSQWSINNLTTYIPAHKPYYPGSEIYWSRESAPLDRAVHGIVTVTLEHDYKVRFASTRSAKANSALQTTSQFDLRTGLPMEDSSGITPPKAYVPKKPRPYGRTRHYKAIFTSIDKVVVLFPCGTLVFFTPMSADQMESHADLVKRLQKAKDQDAMLSEMTERKVREALREGGVAGKINIGPPQHTPDEAVPM